MSEKKVGRCECPARTPKGQFQSKIAAQAVELSSKSGVERIIQFLSTHLRQSTTKVTGGERLFHDILEEDAAKCEPAEHATQNRRPACRQVRQRAFVGSRLLQVALCHSDRKRPLRNSETLIRGLQSFAAPDRQLTTSPAIGVDVEVTVNYKPMGGADGDLISLEMR